MLVPLGDDGLLLQDGVLSCLLALVLRDDLRGLSGGRLLQQ
jgi:hypothetical protein